MSELEIALSEFREAMLAKFVLRAPRRGAKSATIDGNLERMERDKIEGHYRAEIAERMEAVGDEDQAFEDIDVTNMAFLDWYLKRGKP
jgi:hypothetical protein